MVDSFGIFILLNSNWGLSGRLLKHYVGANIVRPLLGHFAKLLFVGMVSGTDCRARRRRPLAVFCAPLPCPLEFIAVRHLSRRGDPVWSPVTLPFFAMVGLYNKFTHKSTYTRICAPSNLCVNFIRCNSCHGRPHGVAPTRGCGALPQTKRKRRATERHIGRSLQSTTERQTQILHFTFCILHFGATHR